jgi:hypothetical protein
MLRPAQEIGCSKNSRLEKKKPAAGVNRQAGFFLAH